MAWQLEGAQAMVNMPKPDAAKRFATKRHPERRDFALADPYPKPYPVVKFGTLLAPRVVAHAFRACIIHTAQENNYRSGTYAEYDLETKSRQKLEQDIIWEPGRVQMLRTVWLAGLIVPSPYSQHRSWESGPEFLGIRSRVPGYLVSNSWEPGPQFL